MAGGGSRREHTMASDGRRRGSGIIDKQHGGEQRTLGGETMWVWYSGTETGGAQVGYLSRTESQRAVFVDRAGGRLSLRCKSRR